jgi:hypothetical protein
LSSQQADHEAGLDPGAALVAVERGDLAVDPRPVDLAAKLHQLVPHVDDLVEPRAEQIALGRRLTLLRPHRLPPRRRRNHGSPSKGIIKLELQGSRPFDPRSLQSKNRRCAEKRFIFNRLAFVHGRLA